MRITKLPWLLLTGLTSATPLSAIDLVNNIEVPGARRMVLDQIGYGLSIRTASHYTSPDSLTVRQYLFEADAAPLTIRVFHVAYPDGVMSPTLTVIGEFVPSGFGLIDVDLHTPVFYEPASEILFAPDSEYLFLVEGDPEGKAHELAQTDVTEAGSEIGWSLVSDWYFFGEEGFPIPLEAPLQMQLRGGVVEVANRPPEVASAVPSVGMLWPPNGALMPVEVLGIVDPDGDPVTVRITEVLQDEPVTRPAPNRRTPDAVVNEEGLWLRAERLGSGSGRVYSVHFEATDGKPGGVSTGSIRVTVPVERKVPAFDDGPTGGYYDSTRTSLSGETVR